MQIERYVSLLQIFYVFNNLRVLHQINFYRGVYVIWPVEELPEAPEPRHTHHSSDIRPYFFSQINASNDTIRLF
jgi:hypothetical protein